jgi:predicted dithiol-disulfide oxidoreductase (DUF899 family)
MTVSESTDSRLATAEQWLEARRTLLEKEKELTRHMDEVSALRRQMPWQRVEKKYVFEGPTGLVELGELFQGRSQLIVYHFMLGPGWDAGCSGCSFICDHVDGARQHFENHDVKFVAVSRATWPEIERFRRRMGWTFQWVSSADSDFNYDYGVSFHREELDRGPVFFNFKLQILRSEEQFGISVFAKGSEGEVYHTWSGYERAGDILIGAHNWLDLTPKGRNEESTMDWVRLHDQYGK